MGGRLGRGARCTDLRLYLHIHALITFFRTSSSHGLEIRLLFAYTVCVPEDEKQRGALLIAASLIAAIRLRGEPVQPSPRLKATIYDSVEPAVLVWRELQSHKFSPLN